MSRTPQSVWILSKRVIRGPCEASERTGQDQSTRARRKGRGEKQRERPAFGHAVEDGFLGPGRVHNCTHIVHPILERRHALYTVRKAHSASIKQDHTSELGKPVALMASD